MTKFNLGWIVGFYEGEGTVFIGKTKYKHKTYKRLKIGITQKQKQVLVEIKTILGFGGVYFSRRSDVNKQHYIWAISGKKAVEFGKSILPYIKSKYKYNQLFKNLRNIDKYKP